MLIMPSLASLSCRDGSLSTTIYICGVLRCQTFEFRRLWIIGVMWASWQWLSTSCKRHRSRKQRDTHMHIIFPHGSRHPLCHKISHGYSNVRLVEYVTSA